MARTIGTKRSRSTSTKAKTRRRNSITHTACEPCREKRAKCDGKDTCTRCETRKLDCRYTPRSWESKSTLRDLVDDCNETIAQQTRLLDAITSPATGDLVVDYLREYGLDDVSRHLHILTRAYQADDASQGATSLVTPSSSVFTDMMIEPASLDVTTCSGDLDCECDACWSLSTTTGGTDLSPSGTQALPNTSPLAADPSQYITQGQLVPSPVENQLSSPNTIDPQSFDPTHLYGSSMLMERNSDNLNLHIIGPIFWPPMDGIDTFVDPAKTNNYIEIGGLDDAFLGVT